MGLMMFINSDDGDTEFGSWKSCYFIQTSNYDPKTRPSSYMVSVVLKTSNLPSTLFFLFSCYLLLTIWFFVSLARDNYFQSMFVSG